MGSGIPVLARLVRDEEGFGDAGRCGMQCGGVHQGRRSIAI